LHGKDLLGKSKSALERGERQRGRGGWEQSIGGAVVESQKSSLMKERHEHKKEPEIDRAENSLGGKTGE